MQRKIFKKKPPVCRILSSLLRIAQGSRHCNSGKHVHVFRQRLCCLIWRIISMPFLGGHKERAVALFALFASNQSRARIIIHTDLRPCTLYGYIFPVWITISFIITSYDFSIHFLTSPSLSFLLTLPASASLRSMDFPRNDKAQSAFAKQRLLSRVLRKSTYP